jgi:hypothetical protein
MHRWHAGAAALAGLLVLWLYQSRPAGAPEAERLPFLEAPAGERPAHINPAGETVLPNGRVITPRGRQFFTAPHPYGLALSPDGRTVVTANSGTKPFSVSVISLPDGRVRQIPSALNATFMGMAMTLGLDAAITNPLEATVHTAILAGDLFLGHDTYGGKWIKAFRKREKAKQAAG